MGTPASRSSAAADRQFSDSGNQHVLQRNNSAPGFAGGSDDVGTIHGPRRAPRGWRIGGLEQLGRMGALEGSSGSLAPEGAMDTLSPGDKLSRWEPLHKLQTNSIPLAGKLHINL